MTATTMIKIKPNDLRVDPRVQRAPRQGHIARIAKRFNPELVGVLHVVKRADNHYYVIDGQHRCEAAKVAGQGHVPVQCVVHDASSLRDQARLFDRLNDNRLAVDSLSMYHVRTTQQDPVVTGVANIVAKYGLTVPRAASKAEGCVTAVAAMEAVFTGRIYKTKSAGAKAEKLSITLQTLSSAWGKASEAYEGSLIKGLGAFYMKHDGASPDRLSSLLRKTGTPGSVVGKIKALSGLSKISPTLAAVQVFEGIYNSKLKDATRLKP